MAHATGAPFPVREIVLTRSDAAPGGTRPTDPLPTISIVREMRRSYLDYAMSVIVSRAIPDLRDGLKPAHRRILYAMLEGGYLWSRPYRKSARVVGDVIGRYHPHGDQAVYDTLVRLAQEFSMRLPLVDGQGNFGSLDGDMAAAMRYTEVRLARAAESMLADIDRGTVDFQENYDGQDREPVILPARIPNLLVNGSEGIAVGMATRIPPHNLGEVIDAALALVANPEIRLDELMEIVPGPDFPTGGQVVGQAGIRATYALGRGSIHMRSRSRIEAPPSGRTAIVIDEVPFQVNKAGLVEEIARLARDRVVEGIAEVRDESDRDGIRVVIDLKRDATPEVVRNQLHRFSRMQTHFGANLIALVGGRPERFTLKSYLEEFLRFRQEVVVRRTTHDLGEARSRAHLLCGLAIAVENIDEVVATIRGAPDPAAARASLLAREWDSARILPYLQLVDDPGQQVVQIAADESRIRLSEEQARAILELRLQRLTGLGREEITGELRSLSERIADFLAILASRERILAIVGAELVELSDRRATPRRTEIIPVDDEVEDEALIEPGEMVVTVTRGGYIKRTPVAEFRTQQRGGKGLQGMSTREADFVTRLFVANTHTPVLFFTTDGRVYQRKVWQLPLGARTGRGKAMVNVLPIGSGISVSAMMPAEVDDEDGDEAAGRQIVLATSSGRVRRNPMSMFRRIRSTGIIAMKLDAGVRLIGAAACSAGDDVFLVSARGQAGRFAATDLREFRSRESTGVRGLRLAPGDEVVSVTTLPPSHPDRGATGDWLAARRAGETDLDPELAASERMLLLVDSAGFGKRTSSHEFPTKGRGGKGVRAMQLPADPGRVVVAAFPVAEADQIMLATDSGQSLRCPVTGVSRRSRTAGGVRLLRTGAEERVVSVARLDDAVASEGAVDGEIPGPAGAEPESAAEAVPAAD